MDQSAAFYQVLTTTSFTLLGIWVGVMQFAHGGRRTYPARHAETLVRDGTRGVWIALSEQPAAADTAPAAAAHVLPPPAESSGPVRLRPAYRAVPKRTIRRPQPTSR